jgi:hypothetical protein
MRHSWWAGALLACALVATAQAQSPVRVRGTIVAIDGMPSTFRSHD